MSQTRDLGTLSLDTSLMPCLLGRATHALSVCCLLIPTCLKRWEASSKKRLDIHLFFFGLDFSLNMLKSLLLLQTSHSMITYLF